jgi:hypothetical protein
MKKRILSYCFVSLFCLILQAQVFVIERGSNTTLTFSNIKAAVDVLQDNDRLYLPPGEISLKGYTWTGYDEDRNETNTLVINKNVSIYGAGYADGANSTIIKDGTLVIGKDADGSSVTGILADKVSYTHFILDDVSNVVITRCKIGNSIYLYGSGNNIVFSECEISAVFSGTWISGQESNMPVTFAKCIFSGFGDSSFKYATVSNSLFLMAGSTPFPNNSSFSNNIFVINQSNTEAVLSLHLSASNNTFSYNLFVGGSIVNLYPENNNTFSHNITNEPYENVFVDPANGDYHLQAGCSGKNAGSDGRDVGIYGTAIPFKENKMPSNPHFITKIISPETDETSKLPVNIKIEAQDR